MLTKIAVWFKKLFHGHQPVAEKPLPLLTPAGQLLLSALEYTRMRVEAGDAPQGVGICSAVYSRLMDLGTEADVRSLVLAAMRELFKDWPDKGADDYYPIGGPDQFWNEVRARTAWDNPRRVCLLYWMIAEIKRRAA